MRVLTTVVAAALLASSGAAAAERLSSRDYLRLSRCAGLMAGAGVDSTAVDALLQREGEGRPGGARAGSRVQRQNAERQMRQARTEERARLQAELETQCAAPTA